MNVACFVQTSLKPQIGLLPEGLPSRYAEGSTGFLKKSNSTPKSRSNLYASRSVVFFGYKYFGNMTLLILSQPPYEAARATCFSMMRLT